MATRDFGLDISVPSYGTTSTSVWGDYAACQREVPPPGPVITHGHSKDNLPELKQFMTELLCVDRGVPIFGGTLDGNSSDKTSNNKMLSRIAAIMARQGLGPGAFVYVADSAMVTGDNLEAMRDLPEKSMLVLKDFHYFLGDGVQSPNPLVGGSLREQIRHAWTASKVFVILGCELQLPGDLAKEFTVLDLSLPDLESLREIAPPSRPPPAWTYPKPRSCSRTVSLTAWQRRLKIPSEKLSSGMWNEIVSGMVAVVADGMLDS